MFAVARRNVRLKSQKIALAHPLPKGKAHKVLIVLLGWQREESGRKVRGVIQACLSAVRSPLPHGGHVLLISGVWRSMTQSRQECGVS